MRSERSPNHRVSGLHRRGRLRRRDRGAAAVELGVVLPILLSIVMGVVDFGMILHDHQTLQDATRVTAREAIVGSASPDGCATESLSGAPNADTVSLICGLKGSLPSDVRVKLALASFDEGEKLTLCSMAPTDSVLGVHRIFGDGTALAKFEMRIENTDYATFDATEESALAGQDWAWCV